MRLCGTRSLLSVLFLLVVTALPAQRLAVKTNLFYGAYTQTPNVGVELSLSPIETLDIGVGYNPWNLAGSEEDNRKLVHVLGSVEYRYWLCERFNGHFFGAHALASSYNIGQHELPLLFGKGSGAYRHQGWAAGVGVTYGYQFLLGRHWNLEASLGLGYLHLSYDQNECPKCGQETAATSRHYFGPTRGGLSLLYVF